MIELAAHADGVVLSVKVEPGSRHQGVRGEHGGALKVAVRPAPEKGKANLALIETLATELGVKKQQIELLAGATSGRKKLLIRGVGASELRRRIEALLAAVEAARRP